MVVGSILIIFDITGWYLAGLVSRSATAFLGFGCWWQTASIGPRQSCRAA